MSLLLMSAIAVNLTFATIEQLRGYGWVAMFHAFLGGYCLHALIRSAESEEKTQ